MPTLLALIASALLGVADFLGGVATRRSAAIPVMVISQMVGLFLSLAAAVLISAESVGTVDLLWGALAGLAGSVGLALLYQGLAGGVMTIVAPIVGVVSASIPAVTGMLLGERPGGAVLAGMVLAILSIGLVSYAADAGRRGVQAIGRQLTLALLAGLCFGMFFVAFSRPSPDAGLWPIVAARVAGLATFLLAAVIRRDALWPPRSARAPAIGASVLDITGTVLYVLSVHRGPLAVVGVLTSLYPAATVALAIVVLRERVTRTRLAGMICCALAVAMIVGG